MIEILDHYFGVQALEKSANKHKISDDAEFWASVMPLSSTRVIG